jgi:predicted NACHT family NTPase
MLLFEVRNVGYINWWRTNGKNWAEKLRNVMIEYRNIGHDWQFSEEQKQLLRQYYDANQLLVECLKSDCYVSRDVRQYIEDTLLLPIAEIKPYR